MIRAHVIISGFVQGVGFRYFLKEKADELRLAGWVRNTPDGDVETVVEGEEDKIDEVITACKEGPPPASVKNVDIAKSEARGDLKDFEIRYY